MAIEFVDRVPMYPGRIKFTKEDGTVIYGVWERADSPTVEGTPLNAATLNAMQAENGLSANAELFIAKGGSDVTGNGTQASPFASFTKALSSLPKNLNGHDVYLHVGDGVYAETVVVSYFFGGTIVLRSGTFTISGLQILNCTVLIDGASVTIEGYGQTTYGLTVQGYGKFRSVNNMIISNTGIGIHVSNGSFVEMQAVTATINSTQIALHANGGSTCSMGAITGVGNENGIDVSGAATVSFLSNDIGVRGTLYSADVGGRIFAGPQVSAPQY